MKNLLIIGVDPGVNLGYSLLNIDGEVLKYGCFKNIGLNNFVKFLIKNGNVAIVGTDRKNVPKFIDKLGAVLNVKVVYPEEDLLIKEKMKLIKDFKVSNKHERDALAAGIFTFKKIRKLMSKVDFYLSKRDMNGFSSSVKKIVLRDDVNLNKALELVLSDNKNKKFIL